MRDKIRTFLLLIFLIICGVGCGHRPTEIDQVEDQVETKNQPKEYDSLYGKPLIVLIDTDPWQMVIGSDVPTFALYEKGQVIYKAIENGSVKIYEVKLTKDEIQQTLKTLVPSDDIYEVNEYIEASNATDQPTNILQLDLTQKRTISVYGHISRQSEDRNNVPEDLLLVYDNIKKYSNKSVKEEWLPNKIEVMFWDYDYAPSKRPWIKNFPDLNSPTTIKFENDSYSVFIEKKDYEEFKQYYKSMGEKEAVEINGKKMAISYRLPFPNIN